MRGPASAPVGAPTAVSWLGAVLAVLAAACGPRLGELRDSVMTSPHRRVAVFAFTPPAGAGESGRLAGAGSREEEVIYKLLRRPEWLELEGRGVLAGSPKDLADGFIHFSTAAQVRETCAKHFADAAELVLLEVDPGLLPEPVRWEKSRGGALFPHLYAELPLSAVRRSWTLSLGPDGLHRFPDEFP